MESHLHSLVLSACWRELFSAHNVSQHDTKENGVRRKERNNVILLCVKNSRVIQQQDNGVELFSGSVISSERHDEVIETVPCRLSWHDDDLVFKAISLCILKAVVHAALCKEWKTERYFRCVFIKWRAERGEERKWLRQHVIEWLSWRKSDCPPGPVVGSKTELSQPTDGTRWASSQCTESWEDNLSHTWKQSQDEWMINHTKCYLL